MKKLYIVGAGGFGREVLWLARRMNEKEAVWNIQGFIDDNPEIQNTNQILKIYSLMVQLSLELTCSLMLQS